MNKKGDAPFLLLIMVALALILLSLFSFASLGKRFVSGSAEIGGLLSDGAFYEEYVQHESELLVNSVLSEALNDGVPPSKETLERLFKEQSRSRFLRIEGTESFLGKVERGEFRFEPKDGRYEFELKNVEVYSRRGAHRFTRTFDVLIQR